MANKFKVGDKVASNKKEIESLRHMVGIIIKNFDDSTYMVRILEMDENHPFPDTLTYNEYELIFHNSTLIRERLGIK